jgi:hypothetical protein
MSSKAPPAGLFLEQLAEGQAILGATDSSLSPSSARIDGRRRVGGRAPSCSSTSTTGQW